MSAGVKTVEEPETMTEDDYKWHEEYDIEPQGFSSEVDMDFFGDDSPHKPPVFDVDVKMAADIEITDDGELVDEVRQYWFPEGHQRYEYVAKIVFNDASVWYMPLASWEKDYERFRCSLVEDYIPDVIQWQAIVDGRDPSKALSRFRERYQTEDDDWVDDIEDAEMTEEQRQWFNRYANWVDHIDRTVESGDNEVNISTEDDTSWEEDW